MMFDVLSDESLKALVCICLSILVGDGETCWIVRGNYYVCARMHLDIPLFGTIRDTDCAIDLEMTHDCLSASLALALPRPDKSSRLMHQGL